MLIPIKGRYAVGSKRGSIRVSKIVQNKPIEYEMRLYDGQNEIRVKKNPFASLPSAISYATLLGFNSDSWTIEKKDV